MKWISEYATGIHNIDAQHRVLIRLGTQFEKAAAKQANWIDLYFLNLRTRTFVEYHCCAEESLMRLFDIPDAAAHCAKNRQLLQRISALERLVQREGARELVLQLMRHLLCDHVRASSKQFAEAMIDSTLV